MSTPRGAWPLIVAALIGAGLFLVPVASAGVKPPGALVPASLVKVDRMPVFTWAPVKGADHYEFQMAADKGFNSTVVERQGVDQEHRGDLSTSLINGTYYWRVRSVTADNKPSVWTKTRTLALKWAPVTNITTPADGAAFITPSTQPSDALILRWAPMSGAAQYAVTIAADPVLTTVITSGGNPEVIDGTAYTVNGDVPDGTYFWSVTPIDAEGHKGLPSPVRSFVVHWNASAGTPIVTDLSPDPELMDPLFSWGTVLGASSYEVEISTSSDFAPGSKVVGADDQRDLDLSDRRSSRTTRTTGGCDPTTRPTTQVRGRSARPSPRRSTTSRPSLRPPSRTSGCATCRTSEAAPRSLR